jgi:hypothetical protein
MNNQEDWESVWKRERERERQKFGSLTSYKAQLQQQQLQGYSLHEKATCTHFHVYVSCTLVPFMSFVARRRHDAVHFSAFVDIIRTCGKR